MNPRRDSVLAAQGVSFAYDDHPVLEDVSFRVSAGEFVALVGPNGSGKSTLLKVLLGLLPPQRGTVELLGAAPGRLKDRGRLGYVPQRPSLAAQMPVTVREIVATGRLPRRGWWRRPTAADRSETTHAIESVALDAKAADPVSELSGGEQQRAFIARAFATKPDVLVLDEPIAGVDADSQRRFRDSLMHLREDHGSAVLLVSHELGAVSDDLDRVLVLKRSIVFDGPPAELTSEGVHLGVHREDLPLWLEGLH